MEKLEHLLAKIDNLELTPETRELLANLAKAAFTDNLTGLPNRRLFEYRLQQSLKQAQAEKSQLSVLFLDLDNFKDVNDELGHTYGDKVLKETAALMKRHLRAHDLLARWGGEEFAAILPHTNTEQGFFVAERIRRAIKDGSFWGQKLTISCGIATFPTHARDAGSLIALADQAMYFAKAASKNKVTICGEFKFKRGEKAALGYKPGRNLPTSIWAGKSFFLVKNWLEINKEIVLAQTDRGPVYLEKKEEVWFVLT